MGRYIILFMLLAWAAYMDIRERIIPDHIPCCIAVVGLILPGRLCIAGVLAGVPFLLAGLTIGGIGGGDIKLMSACGLVLGFKIALAGELIALCMLILFHGMGMCIRKLRKREMKTGKEQAYPLVPFLLLGMLCSITIGGII